MKRYILRVSTDESDFTRIVEQLQKSRITISLALSIIGVIVIEMAESEVAEIRRIRGVNAIEEEGLPFNL